MYLVFSANIAHIPVSHYGWNTWKMIKNLLVFNLLLPKAMNKVTKLLMREPYAKINNSKASYSSIALVQTITTQKSHKATLFPLNFSTEFFFLNKHFQMWTLGHLF